MKNTTQSNKEREIKQFPLTFAYGNTVRTADVHEIDMCGWTLFECFLSVSTVIYLGLDNDDDRPEWIDMDDANLAEYATCIADALIKNDRAKTA